MKMMKLVLILVAAESLLVSCRQTRDQQPSHTPAAALRLASFGGSFQDDLLRSVVMPICKEVGCSPTVDAYSGEYDHLSATIKNGTNPFDLVHVETRFLRQGKNEGVLTPIDWNRIPSSKLVPGATDPYGVGLLAWSLVMTWNQSRLPAGATAPSSWKDFFDVKKYPGPRAMRNTPEGNIELALLADGVARQDLYKQGLDVDRALRKLSTIKPFISWWSSGAELEQKLSTSSVMAAAWNGRVYNLRRTAHIPLEYTYIDSISQFDWWIIPSNSSHKDVAAKFLAAFVEGQGQATISQDFGYGPVALKVLTQMEPDLLKQLPSYPPNAQQEVPFNGAWWAENQAAVQEKWNTWLLQQ